MRKLPFYVVICLVVLLAGCPETAKNPSRSQLKRAVLKATSAEVSSMLMGIRTLQTAYKIENGVYMECWPSPPGGGTDAVPDVWVDAGGFEDIGFRPTGSVRYQYAVTVSADGESYEITATGDLDKNGVKAVHTVTSSNPRQRKEPAGEY